MSESRIRELLVDAGRTVVPARADRHGPLPPILLLLTAATGVVDAVSYLKLGHVFVANMTGNVVFVGFALAGAAALSVPASLVAVGAFLLGAGVAGELIERLGVDRGRLLSAGVAIESVLIAAALVVSLVVPAPEVRARYPLIVLLAVGMGVQNAIARKLAVPDMTTTVLTLTLTGLAADTTSGAGVRARPGRRIIAVLTMFAGALVGGVLTLRVAVPAALGLGLVLTVVAATTAWLLSRARPAWTRQS